MKEALRIRTAGPGTQKLVYSAGNRTCILFPYLRFESFSWAIFKKQKHLAWIRDLKSAPPHAHIAEWNADLVTEIDSFFNIILTLFVLSHGQKNAMLTFSVYKSNNTGSENAHHAIDGKKLRCDQ